MDFYCQLDILKERGLTIEDEEDAIKFLHSVSYFRFANYLQPMELNTESHRFAQNSSFTFATNLYVFDRELRSLIFTAIQDIEIAFRTRIIHYFQWNMVRFGSWMPANLRIKVFSIIVLQLQRQLCQEEGDKRVSTSTISIFRELDKMYCGVKKCLRSSCSHLEQTFSNNAYNAQLFTFSMAYYRQFSSQ